MSFTIKCTTLPSSQSFLNSLPEIVPGETFFFSCHPQVPCFNACCAELTLPLTPYDVLRLTRNLGMSSDQFFEEYVEAGAAEDTGFPVVRLLMEDIPGKPCPFVTEKGCGVYPDRPSACRTYPLGRACRPDGAGGLLEQYFLVREEHCRGFEQNAAFTTATWLTDQGLVAYHAANDRYMLLLARYKEKAGEAKLSSRLATMALLCLYQQDRFADLIRSMKLLERVQPLTDAARERLPRVLEDPEARLDFALDWLELVVLGQSAALAPVAPQS